MRFLDGQTFFGVVYVAFGVAALARGSNEVYAVVAGMFAVIVGAILLAERADTPKGGV